MTEDELSAIVDALVSSYDAHPTSGAGTRPKLPSRDAIIATHDRVRELLFPGFYRHEQLPDASRRFHVGTWICELLTDLTPLISRALRHCEESAGPAEANERARQIAAEFTSALPALRETLREDASAAVDGDPAARNIEEVVLTYPGFEAIMAYRVAHWLHLRDVPYVPRVIAEHAHTRTGIDIHPGARIGRRFFIDHGTGVVIGETTDIGDNIKIYQGVTLGALSVHRSLAGSKRHPTLQDSVVIYAGATVLGGATVIGEGATIGGNAWVTKSVAAGTTVIEESPCAQRGRPSRG